MTEYADVPEAIVRRVSAACAHLPEAHEEQAFAGVRIDVPGWASLAQLHEMLLACFGRSGKCLHVFDNRGRSYSTSGYVDAERPTGVTIGSLGIRIGERFCWRYGASQRARPCQIDFRRQRRATG